MGKNGHQTLTMDLVHIMHIFNSLTLSISCNQLMQESTRYSM